MTSGSPASGAPKAPTVGFDLDMTLIDSRPGIGAVYRALADETGVAIDVDGALTRIGPPLDEELARWFPADQVERLADRYRAIYPELAIAPTPLLPGAAEAIAAVRAAGGRVIVVTAKFAANARLHVDHCALVVDEVVGWAFGDGKRDAIRAHGIDAYVGDHVADMRAARAADPGRTAVGVTSGPCDRDALIDAGADVVLADLTGFARWFEAWQSAWVPRDVRLGSASKSRDFETEPGLGSLIELRREDVRCRRDE